MHFFFKIPFSTGTITFVDPTENQLDVKINKLFKHKKELRSGSGFVYSNEITKQHQ